MDEGERDSHTIVKFKKYRKQDKKKGWMKVKGIVMTLLGRHVPKELCLIG